MNIMIMIVKRYLDQSFPISSEHRQLTAPRDDQMRSHLISPSYIPQTVDQHTSITSIPFTGLVSAASNLARSAGVDLKQCEAPGQ